MKITGKIYPVVCLSYIIMLTLFGKFSALGSDLDAFVSGQFEDVVTNGTFGVKYDTYVRFSRRCSFIFDSSIILSNESTQAIRFEVHAPNSKTLWPLMLVVERAQSIFSWQVPIIVRNNTHFHLNQTLCPEWKNQSSNSLVVFSFSTMSPANVTFKFTAYIKDIRFLNAGNVVVSPSSPEYFFHQMSHETESVVVKVESSDSICAILSIQDAVCPVYDTIGIIEHSKYHASMTKKGAITVSRSSLSNEAFFVVLSTESVDFDNCWSMRDIILPGGGSELKTYTSLMIKQSISNEKLITAIAVGFLCFFAVYVATFLVLIIYYYKFRYLLIVPQNKTSESDNLFDGTSQTGENYGSFDQEIVEATRDEDVVNVGNEDDFVDVTVNQELVWSKPCLFVADMVKERRVLAKRRRTFFWDLVTVAIFYFLPVIQLVLNYQKTLNKTGNQDICYYNFYCIHQVGTIAAFNSFISNIGYVMLGLLFLYLVYRKETSYIKLIELRGPTIVNFGIPQKFDLFYAMGLALVMEGLLSGCYHVCPSYSNFQFDTSFMYVIGWLCMLKIYQNRHQDMSIKAHVAYSIIAFVVLFGVIGIIEGNQIFWICFAIIYLLCILYLSFKVYYLGHWEFDPKIVCKIYLRIRCEQSLAKPVYLDRLILLIFGNLVNWALAIYGAVKMPKNFASYLLTIMLANFMMYFLFYLIMKVRHKEKIYFVSNLFLALAVISWVFSLYFFVNQLASWEVSPALSRENNSDCLWLEFYDHHDIWHFLSALSLFFSFLVLLTLDDGLHDVPRDQIKVF